MREHVSCFYSPVTLDYTNEDRVNLALIGPRGGGAYYTMSYLQARNLRDNLDQALLKFADARARVPVYVVVQNAGYEGEKDVFEAKTHSEAIAWMNKSYSSTEIDELHVAIAKDIAGERSYEL